MALMFAEQLLTTPKKLPRERKKTKYQMSEQMKRFYVAFMFSTFIEADTEEQAVKQAEKAMLENGYSVHVQPVSLGKTNEKEEDNT